MITEDNKKNQLQKNKYSEKLKNHPIFEGKNLKSDEEIKIMFDVAIQFCREFIQGDIISELCNNEEDDDTFSSSNCGEKENQKNKNNNEKDNKENCCKENNCKKEKGKKLNLKNDDEDEDEIYDDEDDNCEDEDEDENEDEDELSEEEEEINEIKTQYALLFNCLKVYKLFEHILLKAYLYKLESKKFLSENEHDFNNAISYFKKEKIIANEEEEQSIYLLNHMTSIIDTEFVYKASPEVDFTILTDDEYMISNLAPSFLYKTIDSIESIVERIYNI
jgi:hypothetical protein